ncbi:MAG: hypothetical protein ACRC2K_13425 [Clostridium sp.]
MSKDEIIELGEKVGMKLGEVARHTILKITSPGYSDEKRKLALVKLIIESKNEIPDFLMDFDEYKTNEIFLLMAGINNGSIRSNK